MFESSPSHAVALLACPQSIPVDSCVLGDSDSLFLQQASHLTKGIYGRVAAQNQHALLQYLMVRGFSLRCYTAARSNLVPSAWCSCFRCFHARRSCCVVLAVCQFMYLSDPTSRQHLILPTQSQVDFRATCFCHQQVVDMGVVCPVCLSIFCKSQPKCNVCGTRFAVLSQLGAARPPTPGTQAAPAHAVAAATATATATPAGAAAR